MEDERLVLVVVKKMLVLLGYRVLTATDGIAALTTYEERPDEIDVVLTDVVMPHMGGVELVVALEERGAEIPVVMMSGHTHGSKDPDEVAPGGSRTLPKPVQMEELAQLVSDALSHSTRV